MTPRVAGADQGAWTALVLAGRRAGAADPMAEAAGVAEKCLVPVLGEPMLLRVLRTLADSAPIGGIVVALAEAALPASLDLPPPIAGRVRAVGCAASPSLTVLAAAEALGWPLPMLITTADHPLLTPAMVEHFVAASGEGASDLCVAVARTEPLAVRFPGMRRTVYRFRDARVGGCNLFAVRTPAGFAAFRFWASLERQRKRPWRIARAFGFRPLLRYILGRLPLAEAFATASRTAGLTARPVILPWPEAAVDVDKPADLTVAERILGDRG